mmetsp:Transcript_40882/g.97163  ORF Transcript_40882/g.97163 Transcript_40882/m.97163 type:complete len:208 (+) Transcript_40882:616-1239(+)
MSPQATRVPFTSGLCCSAPALSLASGRRRRTPSASLPRRWAPTSRAGSSPRSTSSWRPSSTARRPAGWAAPRRRATTPRSSLRSWTPRRRATATLCTSTPGRTHTWRRCPAATSSSSRGAASRRRRWRAPSFPESPARASWSWPSAWAMRWRSDPSPCPRQWMQTKSSPPGPRLCSPPSGASPTTGRGGSLANRESRRRSRWSCTTP